MRTKIVFTAVILLLLIGTGVALAANGYTISRHVIGGGGGRVTQGIYTLDYTLGQAVVGTAGDTSSALCAGYWCGMGMEHKIYLPLVLRG